MSSTLPPDILKYLEAQGLADQTTGADPIQQQLVAMGIIEPPPPKPSAWETISTPFKTLFGETQGVGGSLAGTILPEQFEAAKAKLEAERGITPESPWYKRAQAKPGLGDVLAETQPAQDIGASRLGTAVGPIARLAGNIAGDPTSYTPYVLKSIAGGVVRAIPEAAEIADRASEAELTRRAMMARPVGGIGPVLSDAAFTTERASEADDLARAVAEHGSNLQRRVFGGAGFLQEAEPIALAGAATIGYGPEAIQGAVEGVKQTYKDAPNQPWLDTAAEGTNALLQAGLATMMLKGAITEAQAAATWRAHIAEQSPARAQAQVEAVGAGVSEKLAQAEVLRQARPDLFQAEERKAPEAEAPQTVPSTLQPAEPVTPTPAGNEPIQAAPEAPAPQEVAAPPIEEPTKQAAAPPVSAQPTEAMKEAAQELPPGRFEETVYRGVREEGPLRETRVEDGQYGRGYYFTRNPAYASSYARGELGGLGVGPGTARAPKVLQQQVRLENPLRLDLPAPENLRQAARDAIAPDDVRRAAMLEEINDPKTRAKDLLDGIAAQGKDVRQTVEGLGYDGIITDQFGQEVVTFRNPEEPARPAEPPAEPAPPSEPTRAVPEVPAAPQAAELSPEEKLLAQAKEEPPAPPGPAGKVPVEAPTKPAEAPQAMTPEYVAGLLNKADDRIANERVVREAVGSELGVGNRKPGKKAGLIVAALEDPARREAIVKRMDAVEAAAKEKKTGFDPTKSFFKALTEKGEAEGPMGRAADQARIEQAAAGAPAKVAAAEPLVTEKANFYDHLKEKVEEQGGIPQATGIKSVRDLADKLGRFEVTYGKKKFRYEPNAKRSGEIGARASKLFDYYVAEREKGAAHTPAIETALAQMRKEGWDASWSLSSANTLVNTVGRYARAEGDQQFGKKEGVAQGRNLTPEALKNLARGKEDALSHFGDALAAFEKEGLKSEAGRDQIEAGVVAYKAYAKEHASYDQPRIKNDQLKSYAERLATMVEKEGGPDAERLASALRKAKNTEASLNALARAVGVKVAELKPKVEEKLAPVIAEAKGRPAPKKEEGAPRRVGDIEKTARAGQGTGNVTWTGKAGSPLEGLRVLVTNKVEQGQNIQHADVTRLPEDPAQVPTILRHLREDPDIDVVAIDSLNRRQAKAMAQALETDQKPGEGELPGFLIDPDDESRFVRADAEQDRIQEMAARDAVGVSPSWADSYTGWADNEREGILNYRWKAATDQAFDVGTGSKQPEKEMIAAQLKQDHRISVDTAPEWKEVGSGSYHTVYEIPGAVDKDGREMVLRVGAAPYFPLPSPFQKALVAQPLAEGKLMKSLDGIDLHYTVEPRGLVVGVDPLPPGFTEQEMRGDMTQLMRKAAAARIDFTDVRDNQFAYIPVRHLDTMGVGRVDSTGRTWQLLAVDKGVFTDGGMLDPVTKQIHSDNRIALSALGPESQLSRAERTARVRHYEEDAANATGEVTNHDRIASQDWVDALDDHGAPLASALRGVTSDLVEELRKAWNLPEETKPYDVEFKGLTASPHLRGLYFEAADGTGHIFMNPVASNIAARSYEEAVDNALYTVIHEVTHNKFKGHSSDFQLMSEYMENLLRAQGKFDEYRAKVKAAFSEAQYNAMQDALVPEYLRMRRENGIGAGGQSWRARAVEGVPARLAEGGVEAGADRAGRGEEAAASNLPGGVQPAGAVSGGGGIEAGGVRPAAAPAELAPARSAEGEAARPAARGDAFEKASRAIEAYGATGGPDEAKAKQLLTNFFDHVKVMEGRPPTNDEFHNFAFRLAKDIVSQLTPAQIAQRAESLPSPTKPGQMEGALNMLHYIDLPKEVKARFQVWYDLTRGMWPKDEPQRWEDVSNDVHDMLALHTPEEWALNFRNTNGKVSAHTLLLMREVSNELANRVHLEEGRLEDALHEANPNQERIAMMMKNVEDASRAAVEGGLTMSKMGTSAGRALAILRKDIKTLDPQLAFQQDLFASIRERMRLKFKGDPAKADRLAGELLAKFNEIRDSNGDWGEFAQAWRAMMSSKMWPDKILEWYKAGLLGWPSRVANMSSNFLLRGVRNVEDAVAAGIDMGVSKVTGKKRELFLGEASAATLAFRRAWAEALPAWSGEMVRNFRLQPDDFAKSLMKGSMMEDLLQGSGAIGGKLGEFVRFHLKGLSADDAFAKHFIRMDSLYRQVYRKLASGGTGWTRNGGESLAQATERIVGDLHNNWQMARKGEPNYSFQKLRQWEPLMTKAEEAARRDTFQSELGATGKGIHNFLINNPWFQILVPFYRTPTNITKETIARTPLGLIKLAKDWKKLSPAERMSEASRPITGTLMGLGALSYGLSGGVSGGGPVDPDERMMLETTGWKPYSIKLGNQYISFQRLEPLAAILGVGADAAEGLKQGDFQNWRTGAMRVLQSSAENVTNKTFLSSLDAVTAAISHPTEFLGTFIKQMQGSLIPNSIGYVPVASMARALDQTYRQTEPLAMSTFYARLPFLSSTLEPQYSPSGEVRTRFGTPFEQIASPFIRSELKEGPARDAAEEVVRLNASPKAPRQYWLSPAGLRVDFLPQERQDMAKGMVQATNFIGSRLMKDPSYLALPDNEMDVRYRYGVKTKEEVLKDIYSRYRAQVMDRIKPALVSRAVKQVRDREAS